MSVRVPLASPGRFEVLGSAEAPRPTTAPQAASLGMCGRLTVEGEDDTLGMLMETELRALPWVETASHVKPRVDERLVHLAVTTVAGHGDGRTPLETFAIAAEARLERVRALRVAFEVALATFDPDAPFELPPRSVSPPAPTAMDTCVWVSRQAGDPGHF